HIISIELEPVERRPVIGGRFRKNRTRLEANHCFAATPGSGGPSIPSGNERIGAITGNATDAPYCAAVLRARGPCQHVGWIIYRHSHKPATIEAAIAQTPISNIKNIAHDAERR